MSAWTALLPAAMVGTERPHHWTIDAPEPVAHLLQQIEQCTPEPSQRLLRTAAALAACSMAGAQGAPAPADLPAPAAADLRPALADPPSLMHLRWVVHEAPGRLQHEALLALAAAGWRLPPALLPAVLELGRRSTALRPAVIGALGERGLWLAAQNTDWRYAQGASGDADDATRWAHGSLDQRRELLREERLRAPQAARERVAAELPSLPARERAELLASLALGLSDEDEPLLAGLLEDRSREVRQVVIGLLVRLPGSALVARATRRLEALLQRERGLLRTTWTLDAPNAADAAWERDGIEPTRPKNDPLGERGWWLYQLARQVPLAWWCTHTGMTAAELLAWAGKTDWTEALLRAWRDVLLGSADLDWCEALLDAWPRQGLQEDPARVVALLPPERRERHWLRQVDGAGSLRTLLPQLLGACPAGEHLGPELSNALTAAVRAALRDPNIVYDYTLRTSLPELCCLLHLDALAALEVQGRGDETPAHAEALHTVAQLIAARRALSQLPTAG